MKRRKSSGASLIEFAFSLLVLVPLLLGITAYGLNMVISLQTVQLAPRRRPHVRQSLRFFAGRQ